MKPRIDTKDVKNVLNDELKIPVYQRPYKWKAAKHVNRLLVDIEREVTRDNTNNIEYRIGTIILYQNQENSPLEIVDGQQRLVTIALILLALDNNNSPRFINDQIFENSISKNNIKFNYEYIVNFFSLYKGDKQKYKSFLLNNCTFSVISLNDLTEAFQLFDSQNSRGKELFPEDLLKAFHLREMNEADEVKKEKGVKWENYIDQGILNNVIGKCLFRIRNWQRNEWKNYYFDTDEIDEYKGINLFQSIFNP